MIYNKIKRFINEENSKWIRININFIMKWYQWIFFYNISKLNNWIKKNSVLKFFWIYIILILHIIYLFIIIILLSDLINVLINKTI